VALDRPGHEHPVLPGFPVTGRPLTLSGCEFLEARGGKLHKVDGYFDRLTILGQLGLAPGPTALPAG
jgi:predicted ester cyclase